jgi:hypothetical protein
MIQKVFFTCASDLEAYLTSALLVLNPKKGQQTKTIQKVVFTCASDLEA